LACLGVVFGAPTVQAEELPEIDEIVLQIALEDEPAPIDVPALIVDASRRLGVDEAVMLRIAWCESRYDPLARGAAGVAGVFQFAPITWNWVAQRVGFAGASPFDVRANVEAAVWLYKNEGPKHWGCK